MCIHPRLINISNEGRILVNYSNEKGYMAMFTTNGRLMAHAKLTDQNLVSHLKKRILFFTVIILNPTFRKDLVGIYTVFLPITQTVTELRVLVFFCPKVVLWTRMS